MRREVYPVRLKEGGEVVATKTTYSGVIAVGHPERQEFRVIFDTGSGHMVLPSVKCESSTCQKHRRYDPSASGTSRNIQVDGTPVAPGKSGDAVSIGFGTGKIRGEFASELVCLGGAPAASVNASQSPTDPLAEGKEAGGGAVTAPCLQAHFVAATAMSQKPFDQFAFDGILGLGLRPLALSDDLNFVTLMSKSGVLGSARFALYLAEDDEDSEIAFGAHNPARLREPLSWVPLTKPELGYWQVEILGILVDGRRLDICTSRSPCNGILDSGTSHLGVPVGHEADLTDMLSKPAGSVSNCRSMDAPVLELQLRGVNLTLHPENYMRRLPLPRGMLTGTGAGGSGLPSLWNGGSPLSAAWDYARRAFFTTPPSELEGATQDAAGAEDKFCTPKLMPVRMPVLGENAFVLGEPVLHRYYTVFDPEAQQAAFGLARQSPPKAAEAASEATQVVRGEIVA